MKREQDQTSRDCASDSVAGDSPALGRFRCALMVLQAVAALAVGCSRHPKALPAREEATATSVQALNTSPKVQDFAVYGRNSIELLGQAVVTGGDVGVKDIGSGSFLFAPYEAAIQQQARISTNRSLLGDSVLLGGEAIVGDVQTSQLVDFEAQHVTVAPFVTMPALPTPFAVSPGTNNLTIADGATQQIATNSRFATVTLGLNSKLRVSGGINQFGQLQMGQGSRLEVLASTELRILGRLSAAQSSFVGAGTGVTLSARDIRIEISGANGGGGQPLDVPSAASWGEQAELHAVVLAPNGTIRLDQSVTAFGALVGRDVLVGQLASVTFQDGLSNCPASCADANPCTVDACSAGACTHVAVANGTSCNDGNACTRTDTCQAGVCAGSNPVACTAQDQCHTAGTCDTQTGTCSNPVKADGTACSDGNGCTQTDTCQAGACVGANPVTCTALDQCHVAGTCDPASGVCSSPVKPNGSLCDLGGTTGVCREATCSTPAPGVSCANDAECGPGFMCGINNGASFGKNAQGNYCWSVACLLQADVQCGRTTSPCGLCVNTPAFIANVPLCTANCTGKVCGGDVSDGCGGTCPVCAQGQQCRSSECQADLVCGLGNGARFGLPADANVCWPPFCNVPKNARVACGTTGDPCGLCPACTAKCDGRP